MSFIRKINIHQQIIIIIFLLASFDVSANPTTANFQGILNDPLYLLFFLIFISLLPLAATMVTSFTKIIIVLSITRQALGLAQTPPNIVIMSIALLLTCFAMYPVYDEITQKTDLLSNLKKDGPDAIVNILHDIEEPMRRFLKKHAREDYQQLFLNIINKDKPSTHTPVLADDFIILAPSFLMSELTSAFQVGFLIYLPFLVVDMAVANLLMALGMQMLSPTTISLPFKILLFVLVDGWQLICEGLVSY